MLGEHRKFMLKLNDEEADTVGLPVDTVVQFTLGIPVDSHDDPLVEGDAIRPADGVHIHLANVARDRLLTRV